jgi:chromosome partitioning protein
MPKIITIFGRKGGSGKTTTALHLAGYLHRHKGETILIDTDLNQSALHSAKRGNLPYPVVNSADAKSKLPKFKYAVIDTKAAVEPDYYEQITSSSELLILPSRVEAFDLDALMMTIADLQDYDCSYKVLLTHCPTNARSKTESQVREALAKRKVGVFDRGIRAYTAYSKAAAKGCLVYDIKGNGGIAWSDYVAVGDELGL